MFVCMYACIYAKQNIMEFQGKMKQKNHIFLLSLNTTSMTRILFPTQGFVYLKLSPIKFIKSKYSSVIQLLLRLKINFHFTSNIKKI